MPDPGDAPPTEASTSAHPTASGLSGFLAGILGAAVALGFGELIEGTSETIPSLVIAVGEVVTDYTPGAIVSFSIENLGASQKTVLTVGIVVLSLAICGLFGRLAAQSRRGVAVAGFAVFGLIGGWAAARNPLSAALASWIVALAAAALGATTTLFLVTRASADDRRAARTDGPNEDDATRQRDRVGTRRSFFTYAAGAAATALSLVGLGRGLRGPSAAEQAREIYALPPRTTVPESDATGEATAADPNAAGEVPQGIEIPEGIEIPRGIEIPEEDAIEAAADQTGTGNGAGSVTGPEETATPTSTEPSIDDAQQEQGTPTTQPPPEETTTTQPPPEETTTTQPPPEETTTTQPPPEESTTTQPPPEESTTTQPPPEESTTTQPPRSSTLPQVAHLDTLDGVPGISPYVTPISPRNEFYRIDTALTVPQVDPADWRLRITGLVDEPYELTYQEIRAMPLTDYAITLSCVSNPVGGNLVDNAVWTGIPLNVLLQRAGVQRGAQQIVGRSVDDFTAGFPTTAAYDGRNAILAIGMNNEPLPTRHGFPARIVVAGLYGYVSAVKWLEEIRLTTWEGFDGYWVPRGWSKRGPIKTQSRIDVPNRNSSLKVGVPTSIAGVAWAPTRGIRRVETKIDGEDWVTCELGEVLTNETWVQWRRPWTPDRHGSHLIQVRATDGGSTTQGSYRIPSKPNGAEGFHNVSVNVSR